MADMINWIFWLTGAVVWLVIVSFVVLTLFGEWHFSRLPPKERRRAMAPDLPPD